MKKLHGLATRKNRHPLFGRWKQMRRRCQNPNDEAYKNYGARGVFVCQRWQSFQNFIDDMASSFRPGLTIERKDNNGPYSPQNCVWANHFEQSQNSRHLHRLKLGDLNLSIRQWSRRTGIKENTIHSRLRAGWTIRKALITPTGL